jgi:glucose/arabinose dehydrogenase
MSTSLPALGLLGACLLACAAVPASAATVPPGFSEGLVAGGLASPTAMQFAPDARLFVCEKEGRVRIIKGGTLLPTPFVTVAVDAEAERGLLGIAFDPNFALTPWVYIYYTVPTAPGVPVHNRVSRFLAGGDTAGGAEDIILELDSLSTTLHNGGALDFGADGKLYVAVGDNAVGGNAQSLSTRLGKMLRINPDGSIPTDNPFYATLSGPNRAIWSYGLRNPFKFAVNPGGPAPTMLINDVGGSSYEEINDGVGGVNYGYPHNEGYIAHPDYFSPRYAYDHGPNGGCAILGGAFYTPGSGNYPAEYLHSYFFADFCAGFIRRLDPAAGNTVTDFATGAREAVELRVHDGTLYYLSLADGAVYRIDYGTVTPAITGQPADLIVSPGEPATFFVAASGPALSYQWQRNGADLPGATAPILTVATPQLADSGARYRVNVANGAGNVFSREALLTVTLNQPPVATILLPVSGQQYSGGQVIAFAGSAIDPESGPLPPSALTWRVDFHHDTHVHPFLPATSGMAQGTFSIPTVGEIEATVWYRVYLTAADPEGRAHTVTTDITPRVVRLTVTTSPPGLAVRLDGALVTTPHSVDSVVGMQRALEAVAQQHDGAGYVFGAWSDDGPRKRALLTPPVPSSYEARYTVATVSKPPSPPGAFVMTANGRTVSLSWTRAAGAMSYRLEAGTASGLANLFDADIGDLARLQTVVPPGTYAARVRAVNTMGVSVASNEATVVVTGAAVCATPPPPPTGFTAQTGGLVAALAWNPASGASSYRLEAGSASGLANAADLDVGSGATFTGTAPAGTYYTRLRAVNACGASPPSIEVPITLGCSATAVVPGELAVIKTAGAAEFSWLSPLGATSYRLLAGTAPGSTNVADIDLGTAPSLAVPLASIPPGTYYVRLAAVSACGLGAASNEVALTVP